MAVSRHVPANMRWSTQELADGARSELLFDLVESVRKLVKIATSPADAGIGS